LSFAAASPERVKPIFFAISFSLLPSQERRRRVNVIDPAGIFRLCAMSRFERMPIRR